MPRRHTNEPPRRTAAAWPLASVLTVLLGLAAPGCATGERPSFAAGTGDPAVDRLLARLERPGQTPFTADYTVLTRATGATTAAEVAVASSTRRSVTIGLVRFLDENGTARTCDLSSGACIQGIEPQRVSDVQIVPDFYSTSAGAQLRADARRGTRPAAERASTIAGQAVSCLDITLAGGMKTYCATEGGVLALLDAGGTAVRIELTAYTTAIDAASFTTSR